ncbi:HAD family hydrolase [Spirillospora sp. NPDC047279]|uniref:HAD family hydrolase n=1 Tax=Spirillospora sp. NPDC047279 TaxID=3155478 RepID=UPI003411CC31
MNAAQGPPATNAELKRAWKKEEKAALGELGFRGGRGDQSTITLGEAGDWTGHLTVPKRSGPKDTLVVFLDPIGFSLIHEPAEAMVRELSGLGEDAPEYVTVSGDRTKVLPAELNDELGKVRVSDAEGIEHAVSLVTTAVRDGILPWMEERAGTDALLAHLGEPAPSPGHEARRLERLAVVQHRLGHDDEAAEALDAYKEKYCDTGVVSVDEQRRRFAAALGELLRNVR